MSLNCALCEAKLSDCGIGWGVCLLSEVCMVVVAWLKGDLIFMENLEYLVIECGQ